VTTLAPTRAAGIRAHRFGCMGTDVSVLLPPDHADAAGRVEHLFHEWDHRFSRFRTDSELMALNRAAGGPYVVSEPMYGAVAAALSAAQATDGLFDPLLLGRLLELGYDRDFEELPGQRAAAPLRAWHAGEWRSVRLDAETRTVELPAGSGIDLGGLAKGMAVDAAIRLLDEAGVPYAAVNAGGDLAVIGSPPGHEAWDVALEGIDETVSVTTGAMATSSILRRRWNVGGRTRHHLLDPRTGLPVDNELAQASVAAATCAQAEVAAKAVLLAGPVAGADFVERHGLSALVVTRRGETLRLGSWR